jgi:hypothetical protein
VLDASRSSVRSLWHAIEQCWGERGASSAGPGLFTGSSSVITESAMLCYTPTPLVRSHQ